MRERSTIPIDIPLIVFADAIELQKMKFNIANDLLGLTDQHKYDNTYYKTVRTKVDKKVSKSPKNQKSVTPLTFQRKRAKIINKKNNTKKSARLS